MQEIPAFSRAQVYRSAPKRRTRNPSPSYASKTEGYRERERSKALRALEEREKRTSRVRIKEASNRALFIGRNNKGFISSRGEKCEAKQNFELRVPVLERVESVDAGEGEAVLQVQSSWHVRKAYVCLATTGLYTRAVQLRRRFGCAAVEERKIIRCSRWTSFRVGSLGDAASRVTLWALGVVRGKARWCNGDGLV